MKRVSQFALVALMLLSGCQTTSPYDYVENWLVRDDPVRAFALPADLIYVQSELYTKSANLQKMQDHVRLEVGADKFGGLARVFSPLVASSEDVEEALKWYFKYHHKKNRSFIFIGEGEGGRLLKEYEQNNADDLKEMGLVASYYCEEHKVGFVTKETVESIKEAVARARFRRVWGKDMPEGVPSK